MEHDVVEDTSGPTLDPPDSPSKHDRVSLFSSKLKSSTKKILHLHDGGDDSSPESDNGSDIFEDAAFNPRGVLDANPTVQKTLKDKLQHSAFIVANMVKNPRRAMRGKYAKTIAGNMGQNPELYEKKYDEELLDAHAAFERANGADTEDGKLRRRMDNEHRTIDQTESVSIKTNGVSDIEEAKTKLRDIQTQRDSLRAAWILGRHVKRVRVSRPMRHPPKKSEFTARSVDGRDHRILWDKYLLQLALWHTRKFTAYHIDDFDELPFDLKELSLAFQRLAVTSAPWQNSLAKLRKIYLWEDPMLTSKLMAIYWVLWYFQHIATALFAFVIFATIRNKFYPTEIENIKERVRRVEDNDAKAQAWDELIQKYGKEDWIEPLLDYIGPLLQLEVTDITSLLETMQNFYGWQAPRKTVSTLFLLTSCLGVCLFADMEFCLHLIWLGIGMIFFIGWPLAARYPKYRKLVNPVYWLFWDIPDFAELAITQLQEKAILRDASRLDQKMDAEEDEFTTSESETNDPQDEDHDREHTKRDAVLEEIRNSDKMTFRAFDSKTHSRGRLRFYRNGFWYCDKKSKSYYPYSRLSEVRKIDISSTNNPDASRKARIARIIENSSPFQFIPAGIEFLFVPAQSENDPSVTKNVNDLNRSSNREQLTLTVTEADRDKIFSLVISWSNLKWQPLFTLNRRNVFNEGEDHPVRIGTGSKDLDKAIKSFCE